MNFLANLIFVTIFFCDKLTTFRTNSTFGSALKLILKGTTSSSSLDKRCFPVMVRLEASLFN